MNNKAFAQHDATFDEGSFKAHKRYLFKWSFDAAGHQIAIVTTEEEAE